jgi:hypothetical protein
MIQKFKDYEDTKAYGEIQQLPKGGYELLVMGVQVENNSKGSYMKIACDISYGEYLGFFKTDYDNQQTEDKKWHCNYLLSIPNDDGSEQDGWTKRRFKTVMEAFEDSNKGYHWNWDEQTLKGKKIGGLFNIREYEKDGKVRSATNLAQLVSVKTIKDGTFKLPEDKLINKRPSADGFVNAGTDSGKEFNPFA